MAVFPPPPGFFEAVTEFDIPGPAGPALVITHHEMTTAQPASELAFQMAEAWQLGVLGELADDVTLSRVRVVLGQDGAPTEGEWQGNVAGSSAVDEASPQVAILVKKVTGFAGRDMRGRMYVPGIGKTAVQADGGITAAKLEDLQFAFTNFLANLTANGTPMVLGHNAPLQDWTPVTNLVVDARVATQRRRLR